MEDPLPDIIFPCERRAVNPLSVEVAEWSTGMRLSRLPSNALSCTALARYHRLLEGCGTASQERQGATWDMYTNQTSSVRKRGIEIRPRREVVTHPDKKRDVASARRSALRWEVGRACWVDRNEVDPTEPGAHYLW